MTHAEIVEALQAVRESFIVAGAMPMSDEDAHETLLAVITALQYGWQPIETAPKDGSEVLVWDTDVGHHEIARWSQKHSLWHEPAWGYGCEPPNKMDIGYVVYYPTHWQPLPPPPEGGTG